MAQHRYKAGQVVEFLPRSRDGNIPRGPYRITRLLPGEGGNVQYRVQHAADGHERVVMETQIAPSSGAMSERDAVFDRVAARPPRG